MAGPKPCMGYPSRTAAVAALREEGRNTRDIARMIGVSPRTVTALEAYARKRKSLKGVRVARSPQGESTAPSRETVILDLWDSGLTTSQIANRLGIKVSSVNDVITKFTDTKAELGYGDRAIAASTASLLAALRQHHPERCGGAA